MDYCYHNSCLRDFYMLILIHINQVLLLDVDAVKIVLNFVFVAIVTTMILILFVDVI